MLSVIVAVHEPRVGVPQIPWPSLARVWTERVAVYGRDATYAVLGFAAYQLVLVGNDELATKMAVMGVAIGAISEVCRRVTGLDQN